MTEHIRGMSVLVVPVPVLNSWVRKRTAYYDASFLSRDEAFINAHITLLGPWIPEPTLADLAEVGSIAAEMAPFEFSLVDLRTFPDGLIYLEPAPAEPFIAMTSKLTARFPDHPPYGGAFGSVVPHLTLDQVSEDVSLESVRVSLGRLPVTIQATRIDLQWWENDHCQVMASWPLA